MKNSLKLFFMISVVSFSFISWQSGEMTNEFLPASSVTATINGVQWTASNTTVILNIDSDMPGRTFTFDTKDNDQWISIFWKDNKLIAALPVGNHSFGESNNAFEFSYTLTENGNKFNDQVPVNVNFNITSVDNTNHILSGNFSCISYKFETSDTLRITNGVFTNVPFSVSYQ